MKKINLEELRKENCVNKNELVLSMYRNDEENDIRLCSDGQFIIIEEDLETIFKNSDIDILTGNEELYILSQYNKFYKVKGYVNPSHFQSIELIDLNTLDSISY